MFDNDVGYLSELVKIYMGDNRFVYTTAKDTVILPTMPISYV